MADCTDLEIEHTAILDAALRRLRRELNDDAAERVLAHTLEKNGVKVLIQRIGALQPSKRPGATPEVRRTRDQRPPLEALGPEETS